MQKQWQTLLARKYKLEMTIGVCGSKQHLQFGVWWWVGEKVTRFEATNIRQQDSSIQPATQCTSSFKQILRDVFSEP